MNRRHALMLSVFVIGLLAVATATAFGVVSVNETATVNANYSQVGATNYLGVQFTLDGVPSSPDEQKLIVGFQGLQTNADQIRLEDAQGNVIAAKPPADPTTFEQNLSDGTYRVTFGAFGNPWGALVNDSATYPYQSPTGVVSITTGVNGSATNNSAVYMVDSIRIETIQDDDPIAITNATPQGTTDTRATPKTLSVDVADPAFATPQGDNVTVEFIDADNGTTIDTQSITSNQTVSTTYFEATDWRVVANDSYGNTEQTGVFSYAFPGVVELRNESNPSQLLNNTTIDVRLLGQASDSVISRNVTDGTVNLENIPDEQYVIEVDSANYTARQSIIDTTVGNKSVYLLPSANPKVTVRFRLDDETGQFAEANSEIFLLRPLSRNGTTEFRAVASDEFGPAGYTVDLAADERYRIKLRNADGDTRILEPYRASVDETVTLEVSSLSFRQALDEPVQTQFTTDEDTSPSTVRFQLKDTTNQTENVQVKIYERGNESNVILDDTFAGPFGELVVTKQVPNSTNATQFAVEWSADRNGNDIAAQRFSGANNLTSVAIPDWFGSAISVVILLVVAGAGSQVNAPTVGIGVVFVASILWFVGFLPAAVTGGVLAFGLAIPAFYLFSGNGGVR